MQGNKMKSLFRMAAFSVAAFVFCVALTGATQSAAGFADKKAYNKGYRAVRKGDYTQAEKIFRELLNKDAHDVEARLGLSFALLKQRNLQGAYDNAARVIMLAPLSACFPARAPCRKDGAYHVFKHGLLEIVERLIEPEP